MKWPKAIVGTKKMPLGDQFFQHFKMFVPNIKRTVVHEQFDNFLLFAYLFVVEDLTCSWKPLFANYMFIKCAKFSQTPLPARRHHQNEKHYRYLQLWHDYRPSNNRHLYGLHYNPITPSLAIYRWYLAISFTSDYHRYWKNAHNINKIAKMKIQLQIE